jgi:hypothetical protein
MIDSTERRARWSSSKAVRLLYWVHRNGFYVIVLLWLTFVSLAALAGFYARPDLGAPALQAMGTATGLLAIGLGFLHQQKTRAGSEYDRVADRLDDLEFMKLRRALSASLWRKWIRGQNFARGSRDELLWQEVLGEFEELAHKVRVGILDVEITYHMLSDLLLRYWALLEPDVLRRRQSSRAEADLFSELEWLVESFALRHPIGRTNFILALRPKICRRQTEAVLNELRERSLVEEFLSSEMELGLE